MSEGDWVADQLPPRMTWLEATDAGRAWLATAPGLVRESADRWRLRLGQPFAGSFEAFVIAAELPDGTQAVLKVQFPNRESDRESAALAQWDGRGAIRLLDHDEAHHALLLERCLPGTPLSQLAPDDALGVLVGLLPRLWIPAGSPFHSLTEEAAWLAAGLEAEWERAGRPFERRLVDATLDIFATLPSSQGEQVLVNQDLHADNVLGAEREPWLVVDPKPLAGEREFGIAALVRSAELGPGVGEVERRFDRLTSDLGLDRERARLWAAAHAVAWSFDDAGVIQGHLDAARWLLGQAGHR